ncbi:PTS sugar transporter subunit IIC [Spiroplasma endosymbiont of Aspidapion aeneum]|uniref:PTS sugar transporter subunit IIC n=1 Tax=Spiroplasma endosymbiont of Aspidapion aeneum TaxID=3066276 RepID=UPI00313BBA18
MTIEEEKSSYLEKKSQIISEKKNKLSSPATYKFEIPDIKEAAKVEIQTLKNEYKNKIFEMKDPEKYKIYLSQKENEAQIIELQNQYYENLAKVEKKLKRARKNKTLSKIEKKVLISEAKEDIKKFRDEESPNLKSQIKTIEEKNEHGVNKIRKKINTSKVMLNRTNHIVMPYLSALSNQKHLVAIRNSFASLIPIIMIASFITVIRSIPCSTDPNSPHAYLKSYFPAKLDNGLAVISTLTLGLMAVGLAFGIGVNLAQQYNESAAIGGLMGFIGFILWVGISSDYSTLSLAYVGAQGIFVALIGSIIMVEMYRIFKKYNITIRLPKQVPPAVGNSFIAIIPAVVYAMFVILIRYIFDFDLIIQMQNILSPIGSAINDNFGAVILIVLFNSFFWFLGIHGSAITGIITYPFWYPAIASNQTWFTNGMHGECPYQYPEPYYQWMIWIGGAGSVIGLSFASIFFSKSVQNKSMSKAVFIPSLFNISEPMMFGFPIVLNFYLFIPFMLTPVACAIVSTILIKIAAIHWVVLAPWSLPAPIGSYLASGDNYWAIIVSMISIVVATLIWTPFFIIWDKTLLAEERNNNQKEADKLGISVREMLINKTLEKQNKKNKALKNNNYEK